MGRAIRWQALIALLGIVLLAAIVASTAYQFTSVTVPARGGEYTEAVVGSPRTINPLLGFNNDVEKDLIGLIFRGLVSLDERGEVQPAMAESWEISPDQLTYTFQLRQDVRWHDGAPFTADDVIFTVNAMQSDAYAAPEFPAPAFLADLWRSVAAVKVDDYTVRFRLQQPYAPFLYENTIGILPEHLWRNVPVAEMPASLLNQQPVGTGPWRLTDLTALGARLEPNPYGTEPTPYLEALQFRFHPDHDSAFAAFAAGEVDGVGHILPEDLDQARTSAGMSLLTAPLAGQTFIYFNLNDANIGFLADKQVRHALQLALDVPRLIDEGLGGQGVPADGPIMPGTWAYAPAADPVQPDLIRAAELLEEAGWVDSDLDGVRDQGEMTLSFVLLGDNEALLDALASQWAKIGVWAKPQVVNVTSLAVDHLVPQNFDVALVHWQLSGDPDPYPLWHSTQIGDGQNYTGWSHRRADELMEQGRSVADPGRRMQLYEEFQAVFREELPALPLYFDVFSYGVNDDIVKDVTIGRLNEPADRFRTVDQWYIVTERVTAEAEQ